MAKTPSLNPFDVWGSYIDAVSELGEFVAAPAPSNPIGAAIHGRMRDQCDDFSANPGNYAFQGPLNNYAMNAHCTPYWSDQGYDGPELDVPFTGGQCSKRYNFTVTTQASNQGSPIVTDIQIDGPVVGTQWNDGTSGSVIFGSTVGLIGSSNLSGSAIALPSGNNLSAVISGGVKWYRVGTFQSGTGDGSISAVNNGPTFGGADDCGDPEGEIGPGPNPAPDPGLGPDGRYTEGPDGKPILPMPEIPNPFGDPIQLPSIPLPEFGNPAWNPGSQPGDDPADPGVPGTSEDTGVGGEAEGEAPSGEELVGLSVEVLDTPVVPRLVGNSPGRPLFVGALYVFMGNDSGLELQDEGRVLEDGQFFFAERSSTRWKVYGAAGYNLRVTPYYRELPE